MRTCIYHSPVGELMLFAQGEAITGLYFAGELEEGHCPEASGENTQEAEAQCNDEIVLRKAERWLDAYFAGEQPELDFALKPEGNCFQKEVWKALAEIPYGHTVSYAHISSKVAARLGKLSMSCRAVGGAIGRNPISIMIPCHRVIGSDGTLTGYAGGLVAKEALLRHEGILL